jgi:hypothetical protein
VLFYYLLLSCPQPSDAFAVKLDDPEGDVTLVEHDDLVLVGPVVDDVAKGEEGRCTGQHCCSPRRVT